MSEPVIEVVDVQKHYGKVKAVDGLSFTIAPGEFIGFVGPNGAGKSTTIKMLTAQLLPTAGRITVGGVDVAADPNAAARLQAQLLGRLLLHRVGVRLAFCSLAAASGCVRLLFCLLAVLVAIAVFV